MKKIIAFLLACLMIAALIPSAFAEDSDENRELYITDVIEDNVGLVGYSQIDTLTPEQISLMDKANVRLTFEIPEDKGCFSLYWAESDPKPFDVTVKVYNFEMVDSYQFRYYEDGDFIEVEPDIDYLNETISVTLPKAVPYVISCIYEREPMYEIDSVSGALEEIPNGRKSGALPLNISCPAYLLPVELLIELNDQNKAICNTGFDSVVTQIPEGMTPRYIFWGEYNYYDEIAKETKEDYDLIFRMDDVLEGDNVVVKCYDGEWELQDCEVKEDHIASAHIYKTGLVAIFTEKKTLEDK